MRKYYWLLVLVFGTLVWAAPEARMGFNFERLSELPIQNRGRIKPFDTFAMESVQFITGKRSWNGIGSTEILVGWLFAFDKEWENEEFIRVDYQELKKEMKLSSEGHFFSMAQLRENEGLRKILNGAFEKQKNKERLTDLEKKAVNVQNQKDLIDSIMSGQALGILPNPEGITKDWFALVQLNEPGGLPYAPEQLQRFSEILKILIDSYIQKDPNLWNATIPKFMGFIAIDLSKGNYPASKVLQREIHYNHLRPFRWAWILYTVTFILLVISLVLKNSLFRLGGLGALVLGFGLHIYGFAIRCLISGRPPVTNMYESVIWVTWGCVFFAILIWLFYKNLVIPTAASVFAVVGLVLADNLPLALDPSIHPLEPVLRSNYWLTIHVLTITLSYAAFALSLCIGNVVIGYYVFKPTYTTAIQNFSLYMYRAMQIGVVLLAAGTILGGVWADYSWGRFWGWDPKEVWALIALLLYLAVLHGRFTGLLKGFGFAATTVISFLGVLMAWYGVNFVLGVGLHSYGFSSGGMGAVSSYVVAQLAFIVWGYKNYQTAKLHHSLDSTIFPKK